MHTENLLHIYSAYTEYGINNQMQLAVFLGS